MTIPSLPNEILGEIVNQFVHLHEEGERDRALVQLSIVSQFFLHQARSHLFHEVVLSFNGELNDPGETRTVGLDRRASAHVLAMALFPHLSKHTRAVRIASTLILDQDVAEYAPSLALVSVLQSASLVEELDISDQRQDPREPFAGDAAAEYPYVSRLFDTILHLQTPLALRTLSIDFSVDSQPFVLTCRNLVPLLQQLPMLKDLHLHHLELLGAAAEFAVPFQLDTLSILFLGSRGPAFFQSLTAQSSRTLKQLTCEGFNQYDLSHLVVLRRLNFHLTGSYDAVVATAGGFDRAGVRSRQAIRNTLASAASTLGHLSIYNYFSSFPIDDLFDAAFFRSLSPALDVVSLIGGIRVRPDAVRAFLSGRDSRKPHFTFLFLPKWEMTPEEIERLVTDFNGPHTKARLSLHSHAAQLNVRLFSHSRA